MYKGARLKYWAWLVVAFFLLVVSRAYAWDSSQAFNTIAMSYTANTTVTQFIVLNDAQRANGNSLVFTVDVKNGGGRPTQDPNTGAALAYPSQTDSAWITVYAYNSSGALIGSATSQQYVLQNYGTSSNPGWSVAPGDNIFDFTQAAVSYTGDKSQVAYIKIEMKGTDGAWWAGNYGPQWRTPTVTIGTGSNMVYNSEFGIASNGVQAQGWTTSSGTWSNCGVTSGSKTCVTQESVTANQWGGGEDLSGGTTTSQSGGYESVLTSDNANTAASGGDISGGGTSNPEPAPTTLCCGASDAAFSANSSFSNRAQQWLQNHPNGDNTVIITQIGNYNSTTVTQSGKKNGVDISINGSNNTTAVTQTSTVATDINYVETNITGSNNNSTLSQISTGGGKGIYSIVNDSSNSVYVEQNDTGSHYAEVTLSGGNKNVSITQQGSASHMAKIELSGGTTQITTTQSGSIQQFYSITHNCAQATCAAITVTQGQ